MNEKTYRYSSIVLTIITIIISIYELLHNNWRLLSFVLSFTGEEIEEFDDFIDELAGLVLEMESKPYVVNKEKVELAERAYRAIKATKG